MNMKHDFVVLPSKPEMVIVCGLPASGKSTYSKAWVAEDPAHRLRVNYDDARLELYGADWKFNLPEERKMKTIALARARGALEQGLSVIIDNTNLNDAARAPWVNLAHSFGIKPELYEIDTPVDECVRRDRLRNGNQRVGRAVIERMALFNGFIDWNDPRYGDREFVVVDVDGTLADISHRKHFVEVKCKKCGGPKIKDTKICQRPVKDGEPIMCCGEFTKKDWEAFFRDVSKDTPHQSIVELAGILADSCYNILVVSGRSIDPCGIATEEWLDKLDSSVSCYTHLFMRGWNDRRSDVEVKQEILDLLPKDRIAYVLDDRDSVVEMWRRNGLTCLQVADGNF